MIKRLAASQSKSRNIFKVPSMHHGVHGAPILLAPINLIPVVGANSPVLGAALVQAAVEVPDVLEVHLHKQETAI